MVGPCCPIDFRGLGDVGGGGDGRRQNLMPRLFIGGLQFRKTLHPPLNAAETDQPDDHSHNEQPQRYFYAARHYFTPAAPACRKAMIARAIALPRGSPDAVNASDVSVELLEISTATAGPVTR